MRHRSSRGGRALPPLPRLVVPGRELLGPGDWPDLFGRAAPLVMEIGFGKDTFLLDRAAARPDEDHVGVERDPERVRLFLRRAEQRGLDNVRALPVSAELALGVCTPDKSLAELHVYFPDPWPKARHARNRLVRSWFAREAARVLAPGGVLRLATDSAPYVEQMLEVLEADGRLLNRRGAGCVVVGAEPDPGRRTRFEELWAGKGRTIRHLAFTPADGRSPRAPGGDPR